LAISVIELGGGRGKMNNEAMNASKRTSSPCNFRQRVGAERGPRAGGPADHQLTKKGRCRLHGGASGSGGPPCKRNGQYRHDERPKAAIAEQQKFSALLKMLRAGLT